MPTLEDLITKTKADTEQSIRAAYNLGTIHADDLDADIPISPPLDIPDTDSPSFPPRPSEITPAADPYALIEWCGDSEACRLDTWPRMSIYGNNWLFSDVYNVQVHVICPILNKKYGIQIIYKDLSSNYHVIGSEDGHDGAHSFGRAEDIWYPGHEKDVLNVEATRDWILFNHICFPRYSCYLGPIVKNKAAKDLDYAVEAPPNDVHEWVKGDEASHLHNNHAIGKSVSPTNWNGVKGLIKIYSLPLSLRM